MEHIRQQATAPAPQIGLSLVDFLPPVWVFFAAGAIALLALAFRTRLGRTARAIRRHRTAPAAPPRRQPETTAADWWIRGVAVAVLLAVAGAAAYVSYHHFYELALALGERRDMALLYPAMSDGVIVMASLVMVHCSRRRQPAPLLAWAALTLGGLVTLVANVAHGWDGGTGSRLLSALAPVAFVGAYELLMWLVRSGQVVESAAEPEVIERIVPQVVEMPVEVVRVEHLVARDRFEACRFAYAESLQPGQRRLGRRPLKDTWALTENEVAEIQAEVDAERAAAQPDEQPSTPDSADSLTDTLNWALTGVDHNGSTEKPAEQTTESATADALTAAGLTTLSRARANGTGARP
ncbi:hypothetical protein GCM10009555_017090 [Acrocarpospora macrocephala]|uniref:DUF2637 domain-containing protein n=1 Tax=Acrocarpospora macrocephala TaxID=150177 RepID=A0A5M3WGF5_9ACTN|nr:DUF2637 domain-containing protein [Acrocarpospora macrocephala]GES07369.1 hypothetical protein Amac_009640 [Acrocarpospora macrocephala]